VVQIRPPLPNKIKGLREIASPFLIEKIFSSHSLSQLDLKDGKVGFLDLNPAFLLFAIPCSRIASERERLWEWFHTSLVPGLCDPAKESLSLNPLP
jgi:hypothetical protein